MTGPNVERFVMARARTPAPAVLRGRPRRRGCLGRAGVRLRGRDEVALLDDTVRPGRTPMSHCSARCWRSSSAAGLTRPPMSCLSDPPPRSLMHARSVPLSHRAGHSHSTACPARGSSARVSGSGESRRALYRLTQGPKVRRSTAQSTVSMLSSLNCTATRTLPGFFKQRRGIRIDTGLSEKMSARARIPGH